MPPPSRPFRVTRRTVLGASLLGTCGLVAGGAGLAWQPANLRPLPSAGLETLSAEEYSVLAAAADRICPALGTGAPGATATDVARLIDAELAHLDGEVVEQLKLALHLLESGLVGALFGERLRPFTRLEPQERDRVLEAWRSSSVAPRRAAYKAIRSMVGAVYFSLSETWQRIGYPGPPSPKVMRAGFSSNLVDLDSLAASDSEVEARHGSGAP